jgi:hypothetical protein
VLDGLTLEQHGIPTATIITDVFVTTADGRGPFQGITDEVVRERRLLRQLDDGFFRHYMGVLGERRPPP